MVKSELLPHISLAAALQSVSSDATEEDLLQIYLALPAEQREDVFADTARAAKITGMARRTIQLWIETGAIQAARVGRKYYVLLPSLTDYLKARASKAAG